MRSLIVVLLALLLLGGCAFKGTNDLIKARDTERFQAFATGMNKSKTEGERIALSMAFASGMGLTPFYRPETAKDYLLALSPYVQLLLGGTGSNDKSRIKAGRDVYVDSTNGQMNWGSNVTDISGEVEYEYDYTYDLFQINGD